MSPAAAARANIGPLVRASRPSTTDGRGARAVRPGRRPSRTQAPSAAAWRATSSGVRSVPTWPRIPETLIMRVSDIAADRCAQVEIGRRRDVAEGAEERLDDLGVEVRAGARAGARRRSRASGSGR